jgi:hypothetical protein
LEEHRSLLAKEKESSEEKGKKLTTVQDAKKEL